MRTIASLCLLLLAGCVNDRSQPPSAPPPPPEASPPPVMAASPPVVAEPQPSPAAQPPPAPTTDLPSVSEEREIDREMRTRVMQALRPHRKHMRVCYHDAVRRNPRAEGLIRIRLTVAPSGDPVVIDDEGSTVKDQEFITCVRSVLSKTEYPKWQGKAVTVIVPVEFFRRVEGPEEDSP